MRFPERPSAVYNHTRELLSVFVSVYRAVELVQIAIPEIHDLQSRRLTRHSCVVQ